MTINSNSRYANSTVTTATNLDGTDINIILFSAPNDYTFLFTYKQIVVGDFVDVIAYKQYGDPTLWWVIANANPEITNWTAPLPPGYMLRIPSLNAS